uniref:Uncharacterized protein n=1 Tax=Pararge aegeria TaxID=116150 RepID=S4PC99_9NEOP
MKDRPRLHFSRPICLLYINKRVRSGNPVRNEVLSKTTYKAYDVIKYDSQRLNVLRPNYAGRNRTSRMEAA